MSTDLSGCQLSTAACQQLVWAFLISFYHTNKNVHNFLSRYIWSCKRKYILHFKTLLKRFCIVVFHPWFYFFIKYLIECIKLIFLGNICKSYFLQIWIQIVFSSVKNSTDSTAPSRPMPDSFIPPNGKLRSLTSQQFTHTVPT